MVTIKTSNSVKKSTYLTHFDIIVHVFKSSDNKIRVLHCFAQEIRKKK